jgi:hypothetical protein
MNKPKKHSLYFKKAHIFFLIFRQYSHSSSSFTSSSTSPMSMMSSIHNLDYKPTTNMINDWDINDPNVPFVCGKLKQKIWS